MAVHSRLYHVDVVAPCNIQHKHCVVMYVVHIDPPKAPGQIIAIRWAMQLCSTNCVASP